METETPQVAEPSPEKNREDILKGLSQVEEYVKENDATSILVIVSDGKSIIHNVSGNYLHLINALKGFFRNYEQSFSIMKEAVMEYIFDVEMDTFRKAVKANMEKEEKKPPVKKESKD